MNKDPQALIKQVIEGFRICATAEVYDACTGLIDADILEVFQEQAKQGYTAAQALQEVLGDGWQDISTAPKDKEIMVCGSRYGEAIITCAKVFPGDDWWEVSGTGGEGIVFTPTHWQFLPKTPTKE